MATGLATIDFGAFPGKADTSVAVSSPSIPTGALVEAWIVPTEMFAHTEDEHRVEGIRVIASQASVGVGFTINAYEDGPVTVRNEGHRLYGDWQVAWAWVAP